MIELKSRQQTILKGKKFDLNANPNLKISMKKYNKVKEKSKKPKQSASLFATELEYDSEGSSDEDLSISLGEFSSDTNNKNEHMEKGYEGYDEAYDHLHEFVLWPKDKSEKENTGWFFMDDMVRASIIVNSFAELWDAFKWFKESGLVDFVRIKDNL